MKNKKTLFIDRDGTLIFEPIATKQINSLDEMFFTKGVISALKRFKQAGYSLVIVTNQDALGTPENPRKVYENINNKMFAIFASEDIFFNAVLECPHNKTDGCACRKPKTKLGVNYIKNNPVDLENSYMIGDRDTDVEFGENLGIKSFKLTKKLGWAEIAGEILDKPRKAQVIRKTKETNIKLNLNLDGKGQTKSNTGIEFFDHCLDQLGKHGGFDLQIKCKGDLCVDEHHTVEDTALALGQAFKTALGDKRGIERYAWERILVMDDAKVEISIDISNRPYLVFKGKFDREYAGKMPTELVEHFFESFVSASGINMNIKIEGKNTHHKIEACFKAFARVLRDAVKITGTKVSSTKGIL
ncbi:Histidinol phosphatase [Elusimicrobium minutum Pei191]|uniref:Histidine biosynthesis bifunctional protein HisB n=1 Tax=Elusimicrobium minutum (strain Pei191) TaxID=445932 RepID=B2KCM5_ELUMP|nr:bifunctional histidinol-phosphatase/imidazoleglycerol-phosphate dehydratase HisB [Elusimicrobium minutum]ACC98271.1 Histidinol phosphatase [Elusimicrobium minutum Pei191]